MEWKKSILEACSDNQSDHRYLPCDKMHARKEGDLKGHCLLSERAALPPGDRLKKRRRSVKIRAAPGSRDLPIDVFIDDPFGNILHAFSEALLSSDKAKEKKIIASKTRVAISFKDPNNRKKV